MSDESRESRVMERYVSAMDSSRAAFPFPYLLIVLIGTALISLVSPEGTGCDSAPLVVQGLVDASIPQGTNHTFVCQGIGSYIEWNIDDVSIDELKNHSKLKLDLHPDFAFSDGCFQGSGLTIHAKSAPEDNVLSTYAIQCLVWEKGKPTPAISEANLTVHMIGGAGDVELISPASPEGPAIIQWIAPDVLTGSSSPLYYNITVRDPSNRTIAQNTTTDTSFAIDSDLLVPCHSYELTLLPFQQISNHTELGIMAQSAKNYSGTPLPATDVKFSVSLEHDAANVTITFKVNFTSCSLQWPESYTVTVLEQGTNISKQSAKQTVMGTENEYILENLALRKKYEVSIKLEKSSSSSIPEIVNTSIFNVQNLTLTEQDGGRELNVHCDMAKGAEDKNCTVMMRNETGVVQQNCFPTGGRNATCKLSGLALGQYMIQGYDWEEKDTPAVEREFLLAKKLSEDLTNNKEAVQSGVVVGIVAVLILLLIAGLVGTVVAVVVVKSCRKKQSYRVRDTEATPTEVHVYQTAEENEYDKHNIPQQQDTLTESTPVPEPAYAEVQTPTGANGYDERNLLWQQNDVHESTDVRKPACADAQTVITTTAATNNNPNQ